MELRLLELPLFSNPKPASQTNLLWHPLSFILGPDNPNFRTPGTDAAFPLHGVITRGLLLRMLKHRIGMSASPGPPPPARSHIPATQA